jgi:hypothetical protein
VMQFLSFDHADLAGLQFREGPFGQLSAETHVFTATKMAGLPLTTAANAAKLACKPLISWLALPRGDEAQLQKGP